MTSKDNPIHQIEELRAEIRRHDKWYYTYGTPTITDLEYDNLFALLQELEEVNPELVTADSPTQRVGGEPVTGVKAQAHLVPMMSIDNGFDLTELDKFHARMQNALDREPRYAVDWKIDGCAVSLIYKDGVLARAVTRGDGKTGDDITHNARVMRGVPHDILHPVMLEALGDATPMINPKGIVEVRGEAYIPNDAFQKLVALQEAVGDEPFKNSRNATAGALRQYDPKECYARHIHFVAHGLGRLDPDTVGDSWSETMLALYALGMPMIDGSHGNLPYDEAKAAIEQLVEKMDKINYPVDGIVLKLDSFEDRIKVGQTSSRHVSWALAYKWERYEAETKIVKLETQVGKQGALTPVAYYEPVEIAETMVQKSTLFNFDEVERLDPRVGDTVTIEKAGKIIPHLVRVHKDPNAERNERFAPPGACPICGAPTDRDGPIVFCTNTAGCPAQLEAMILAAADRSRLDIDGLGPKAVQAMMAAEVIKDFSSLWELQGVVDTLRAALGDEMAAKAAIPGMTPGKSKKLLEALERAKTAPSWRLLASLNIKHCGRTNSELICKAIQANYADNVNVFDVLTRSWGLEQMMAIDGIGEETGRAILAWFAQRPNRELLIRLHEHGLNMGLEDPISSQSAPSDGPLVGKAVCATGKLKDFSRESIKEAIVAAGGKAASSVSKKTDYLVAGADAGSKLAKAERLGITVLNETEFKELIGC